MAKGFLNVPPTNLASIKSPTRAVWASRSLRSAAHICRCIVRAAVWQSLPVLQSIKGWLMRCHVSAEIHLFPCRFVGSALSHVSFSASKVWFNLSCSSGGSRRGRCCLRQQYFVSHFVFLARKVATTVRWSESWTNGVRNATFRKYRVSPPWPEYNLAGSDAISPVASGTMSNATLRIASDIAVNNTCKTSPLS